MSRPPIFADMTLEAALTEAKTQNKILLVDAMATWCGPCKIMDSTSWVDARVLDAIGSRVLAIQVDIDADKEAKERLKIQAVPTVVAMKDGAEIDRSIGLLAPEKLVEWVVGLERGETSLSRARKASKANPRDFPARLSLARNLLRSEVFDEATPHYVWIWENMLQIDATMVGLRHSVLLNEIHQLVSQHPPARAAFAKLRDASAPSSVGQPSLPRLADWLSLNNALGEAATSLAWFDGMSGKLAFDERLAKLLEMTILPQLIKDDRWDDVAALYPHPVATLQQLADLAKYAERDMPNSTPREMANQLKQNAVNKMRQMAAILVRSLTAAERHDEAAQVRAAAAKLDPSPAMAAALGAGGMPATPATPAAPATPAPSGTPG